ATSYDKRWVFSSISGHDYALHFQPGHSFCTRAVYRWLTRCPDGRRSHLDCGTNGRWKRWFEYSDPIWRPTLSSDASHTEYSRYQRHTSGYTAGTTSQPGTIEATVG